MYQAPHVVYEHKVGAYYFERTWVATGYRHLFEELLSSKDQSFVHKQSVRP